jgi:hypothetical protein
VRITGKIIKISKTCEWSSTIVGLELQGLGVENFIFIRLCWKSEPSVETMYIVKAFSTTGCAAFMI